MPSNIEDALEAWRDGAVVIDYRDGKANIRPAAFVFDTGTGLAWVEPSYADPMGASSTAYHTVPGTIQSAGFGFKVSVPGRTVHVLPYAPEEDTRLVGDSVDWWRKYIADGPLTLEAERAKVRELCGLSQSSP